MFLNPENSALSKSINSTVIWLYGIFGTIVVVIGIIYLLHSNKTATNGYELLVMEQERKNLLVELEQWNTKLSTMISVTSLESSDTVMEKPTRVTYFKEESDVANKIDFEHLLN